LFLSPSHIPGFPPLKEAVPGPRAGGGASAEPKTISPSKKRTISVREWDWGSASKNSKREAKKI